MSCLFNSSFTITKPGKWMHFDILQKSDYIHVILYIWWLQIYIITSQFLHLFKFQIVKNLIYIFEIEYTI